MSRKKGVLLSVVLMAFESASALLLTPYMLHAVGPSEYGVFKLSAAVISSLLLLDLGIGNSVVRYMAKYRALDDRMRSRQFLGVATAYYLIISLLSLLLGAALVAMFPFVFAKGLSLDEIGLGQGLLGIAMLNTAVTLGTSAYTNAVVAHERFVFSRCTSISGIAIRVAMSFFVLHIGAGSTGVMIVNLLTTICTRGLNVLYVLLVLKLAPTLRGANSEFVGEIAKYSLLIFLQMVATQINSCVDQILIGALVSSSASIIAVYGIGVQVVQYYQSIGSSFSGVLMPGVVKMVERGATPQDLCDEMLRVGRLVFTALSIILVCYVLFGAQFVTLWVGAENYAAWHVTCILMAVHCLYLTQAIGTQILWALNEHKAQSVIKMVIVVVNIGLSIALINWNPLIGAALGTAISVFLGDIVLNNILLSRKIKLDLKRYYSSLFRGTLPALMLSFFVGLAIKQLGLLGWFGFVINVLTVVLVFAVSMWMMGFNDYEKQLIKSLPSVLKK